MKQPRNIPADLALSGVVATSMTALMAPSAACAIPAGGSGDIVEAVSPSVVLIETTGETTENTFADRLPDGMSKEDFTRRFWDLFPPTPQNRAPNGLGSGFIISPEGHIVTNNHVIEGAQTVTVKLADGRSFDALVIGTDVLTDIALLQIDEDEVLPALDFGLSSDMRAGD